MITLVVPDRHLNMTHIVLRPHAYPIEPDGTIQANEYDVPLLLEHGFRPPASFTPSPAVADDLPSEHNYTL